MKNPEVTTVCPKCGFPSQGPRVRPHNCAGHLANPGHYGPPISPRPAADSAQDEISGPPASAPGTLSRHGGTLGGRDAKGAIVPASDAPDDEDALLGVQLEMQWERVVGGQREQLIFGAMMLKLRTNLSARGQVSKGGRGHKGEGLEGWLDKHAPKVARSTAYRLMEIAEGIGAEFRLGKKADLEALLAAQVEDLPEKLAKKRAEIESMIEGKSQRQLLLEFGKGADGRSKNPGGFRPNSQTLRWWLAAEYPDQPELQDIEVFTHLPEDVQKRFKAEGDRYAERLTREQRAELEHADDARAWSEQIVPAVTMGIDKQFYLLATDAQLRELLAALDDLRAVVAQHEAARAGKRPGGKKALTAA